MRTTLSGPIALARLVPITASLVLHVSLGGAALVIAGATASRDQVIFLELTELEAPPELPRPAITPRLPDPPRKTVKPIRTPPPPPERPVPLEHRSDVEPVPSEPPTTAAIDPTPVLPGPPTPVATTEISAAPTSSGETARPAAPGPRSATAGRTSDSAEGSAAASVSPAAPVVAAVPRSGVTQRAMPRAEYQYRPAYPRRARDRGIQGTTLLAVRVADDGRVTDVVIKESAGDRALDEAAADAVRRWRFAPARRDGAAVAAWVELPVEFRLR